MLNKTALVIFSLLLLLISTAKTSANAASQIGGSQFTCNEDEGKYFLTTTANEESVEVSFKKALKTIHRQIKKAKGKDAKALVKNLRQDIKNCKAGLFLKETPSYETVKNDCTGNFNTSQNENLLSFEIQGDTAIASGVIDGSIVNKVKKLIRENPNLRTIIMTYMPGSDNDEKNVIAGRLLHNAKIATCVPDNGVIASGAVDLFLAGTTRSLGSNSFVGVHSWADSQGREGGDIPVKSKGHNLFLNYYRAIDVATDFYWFTINAAAANDIHDMTVEERVTWGMETNNN